MIHKEYLKYCLEEIEKKLNWKPSSEWKESDFIRLSEMISEKSNISISPHTLKRLFGKIKYKKYYNPQQATKDALAKYLEFTDWQDFISDVNVRSKKISDQKGNWGAKKKTLLIVSVVVFAGVLLFFMSNSQTKGSSKKVLDDDFEFSLIDSVGVAPYTVSVNYNLSNVKSDSTFIDFGFNHPIKGPQSVLLDKNKFMRNFTYQIPGKYTINLVKDNEIKTSSKVLVMSNDWESYLNYEFDTGTFWIDNKIERSNTDGVLYYTPRYLDSIGFNINQVYYVNHRLYNEFGIDGDNFELNTSFKISQELGGITCYDFVLKIVCENGTSNIFLMENGCSQFSGMKIGEEILSGVNEDLSSFKFNLDTWNNLKISVKDKAAKIYINDNNIYEGNYNEPNGKIVGLSVTFKGTGKLDFINLKDLNNSKEFKDDF